MQRFLLVLVVLLTYSLSPGVSKLSNYWKLKHANKWPSLVPKNESEMDILIYGAIWDVRKRWRSDYSSYARIYLAGPVSKLNSARTSGKMHSLRDAACVFHFHESVSSLPPYTEAFFYLPDIQAYMDNAYERFYLDCPYNRSTSSISPWGVSLHLPHMKTNETLVIEIDGNHSLTRENVDNAALRSLAICVRPLTFDFKEYDLMSNFLVYYSTLGVEHFELYAFEEGISHELLQLFDLARSLGVSIETPVWGFGKPGSHEFLQAMNVEVHIYTNIKLHISMQLSAIAN